MNERQKRFIDYYCRDANASEAARSAGYSARTARIHGAKLLTKPNIREAIDERLKEMASERIANAEEAMMYLTSVVRGEYKEEVVTPSGKKVFVRIPTAQRLRAAETLLRIHGKFKEKFDLQVSGADLFVETLERISAKIEAESKSGKK